MILLPYILNNMRRLPLNHRHLHNLSQFARTWVSKRHAVCNPVQQHVVIVLYHIFNIIYASIEITIVIAILGFWEDYATLHVLFLEFQSALLDQF